MPRRKTLSDVQIASLKPSGKPYTIPDPDLPGFYVRVQPSGTKSFVAVSRAPSGKQIWHTVGPTTLYSIKEAREKAREAIKVIRDGRDRSGPDTFESVAEKWFGRHVEGRKLRSARDLRSYLDRYLIPGWKGRDFTSIRRKDVAQMLDTIEDASGPVAADHALGVISSITNWYAARDDDYSSPIIRGMRRTSPRERARKRILNDDELRQIWLAAESNGVFGAIIRIALLTAQRRDKILTMKWDDIVDGEWIMQTAEREKGTAGSLLLPQVVLDIIHAQPRFASNPYVFSGRRATHLRGLSKYKGWLNAKLDGIENWTLHDLRRTARSLMSRAGVKPHIAERVLGHVINGVEGIYDRHSYREEKAHALAALASLIGSIVNPTDQKVIVLRKYE